MRNLIREIREIRVPKNNASHVLAAGVAYPLLPDMHIPIVGTLVPLHGEVVAMTRCPKIIDN